MYLPNCIFYAILFNQPLTPWWIENLGNVFKILMVRPWTLPLKEEKKEKNSTTIRDCVKKIATGSDPPINLLQKKNLKPTFLLFFYKYSLEPVLLLELTIQTKVIRKVFQGMLKFFLPEKKSTLRGVDTPPMSPKKSSFFLRPP